MAYSLGYRPKSSYAAVTTIDFYQRVPISGSAPNLNYALVIPENTQLASVSTGIKFLTLDKVDLTKIGLGIAAIAGAAYLMSSPIAMLGLGAVGLALAGISALDFNNIIPLQNLHFVEKDIENLKKMEDFLSKINAIYKAKLASLQGLFANANFKFTLDGDAVLKNTINVDIAGDKLTELIDQRVKIVSRRGNSPI
jgi:hypothetical protein